MVVAISVGCCYDLGLNRLESIHYLAQFKEQINGIELLFALPGELLDFELPKQDLLFLQSMDFVSIHMPLKEVEYASNAETNNLLQKALDLGKKVNAKYLLFHPHQIRDFELLENLPMQVCLENMDKKYQAFGTLEKIKQLLEEHEQFGFVLDVCHALDCGIAPKQFLQVKNKIKAMHISSLWQKQGITKKHGFLLEADKEQLAQIKSVIRLPVPKIIESVIYPEKKGFVKKEIELIKSLEGKRKL